MPMQPIKGKFLHQSVLLEEVVAIFQEVIKSHLRPVLIDCTLGLGGHTLALLQTYPNLRVIGIERDKEASKQALEKLTPFIRRFSLKSGNFATILPSLLKENRVCGVLADLGVSSLQLDHLNRGFSFNAPTLDMRMDINQSLDASKVINTYSAYALEKIFQAGEVYAPKKMANLIVQNRPFYSAKNFADFISQHSRHSKHHPATLIFQAIRMEVNTEMHNLDQLLACVQSLEEALVCIISFHSLEDRKVKHAFKEWAQSRGELLFKKPIVPSKRAIQENRRARSAKMRAFYFKKI